MNDVFHPLIDKQQETTKQVIIFLIVDDFEPMRKVTAGQLHALGVRNILTARNGAEALRILRKQPVDIILSDWNMPVMSGLELLKAVRVDERLANMPFIMITAEAERHRIEEAIANGVSDLLVKPYTANGLAMHIERALAARPRTNTAADAAAKSTTAPVPHSHPAGIEKDVIPATAATSQAARPTILVVDDVPDNLLMLAHLFQDDYRVRIAHSGEKGLHICQSNDPPDLVLLDIMMPDMDGFEVARRMREHPTSQAIPVIFVTAMTGEDAHLKCLELGAVDFVTKPIDPLVLKTRVRNFMRYVEVHKQLQSNYDGMLELAHLREDVDSITRHDMKGPLAGVIGLVQALVDDGAMRSKQVEQLRVIEETALQVLNMINLSSELLKIETGRFRLDPKPIAIADLLRRIVELSRTSFAEKHLAIALGTDVLAGKPIPKAMGDAMFCYSLFQNLIKNACEAAPERSRISVILNDEAPLRIIIQNQGAVPADIRERFFDKYVTSGKQGGSGLGTYSAKLLIEAQLGTIALAVSDVENQTTVTVTLPRLMEEATGGLE